METEKAISKLKETFARKLSQKLNLIKVEAPLLLEKNSGFNDDLNGVERPVTVTPMNIPGIQIDVVQSLAKWKRDKISRLHMKPGEGIYTDMRALRPDDTVSNIHSIYVDQWDWEKHILESNRTIHYLLKEVCDIYDTMVFTQHVLGLDYPDLSTFLPPNIYPIHAEDLRQMYPDLNPKEREHEITRLKGAVFIIGIGGELSDGKPHDGRAPDYDDWSTKTTDQKYGLNGDILVWNPVLQNSFELSSMGIRVNAHTLKKQLYLSGQQDRMHFTWHKKLLQGKLPQTIGGGIGQSRLCMLLLQKRHIGEVQNSIWPSETKEKCLTQKINLLCN